MPAHLQYLLISVKLVPLEKVSFSDTKIPKVDPRYGIRQTTRQMGRNTVAILIAVPLQYLLMTVKVVAMGKISFTDTQNHNTVS